MYHNSWKKYIVFWASQSLSQLGSAMTSFALIIWAYTKTNSAFTVSLMTFCAYLPYIFVSLFAGSFVDRHSKKTVMLTADFCAAICSFTVLLAWTSGNLQIWHIYIVNGIIGFMNSFQSPAKSVAIGILVPPDRIMQTSGMDSFSDNLVSIFSPLLAAALISIGGIGAVIAIDLGSFLFAFIILLMFIQIPETIEKETENKSPLAGCKEGLKFLQRNKGIAYIFVTMACLNFFSRLTYENILSPMILARSGNNSIVLGSVTTIMGISGVLGGLFVSTLKFKGNCIKHIYFSAAISFAFGDLLMGIGRSLYTWCIAGAFASFPIPFVSAGQRVILYRTIPQEIQGKVFSLKNAIVYSTIPIGILLGGFLADYVFEPFMTQSNAVTDVLHVIVGTGCGSGMAVMFMCTGILGFIGSLISYNLREIQKLKDMV